MNGTLCFLLEILLNLAKNHCIELNGFVLCNFMTDVNVDDYLCRVGGDEGLVDLHALWSILTYIRHTYRSYVIVYRTAGPAAFLFFARRDLHGNPPAMHLTSHVRFQDGCAINDLDNRAEN